MKNKMHFLFLMITLAACGGGDGKITIKDGNVDVNDVSALVENTQDAMEQSQKRWDERKAKGDTLAMNYKDLQALLPSIPGFEKSGDPEGTQMTVPGMGSWSQASQSYSKGENQQITVNIYDYNGSYTTFSAATAMFAMAYAMEDENQKSGTVDLGIKDVVAHETQYKNEQDSQLIMIVADRFMIELKQNGSANTEELKTIAKQMNLERLTSK